MPLNLVVQLFDHLDLVRLIAGNPSRDDLVECGAGRLAEHAINQRLVAQESQLPQWELVAAYVAACQAATHAKGRDIKQLGSLPAWWRYYQGLLSGIMEASCPLLPNCDYCKPGSTDTRSIVLTRQPQLRSQRDREGLDYSTLRLIENTAENLTLSNSPSGTTLLLVVNETRRGSSFLLDRDRVTLGRDPKCDIVLDNTHVSRRHAEFVNSPKGFIVRDLHSMCGTFVNGEPITETYLHNRDILEVGGLKLVILKKSE
jgi:hypothetical protein